MTRDIQSPTDVPYTDDLSSTADGVTTIVAGSRSTVDDDGLGLTYDVVTHILTGVFDTIDIAPDLIVSGTARGVDTAGEQWAERRDIPVAQFEAPWDDTDHPDAVVREGKYGTYDASAGHRRNRWMAEFAATHGQPGILVALLDYPSNGTESMIDLGREILGDDNVFVESLTGIEDYDTHRALEPVLIDS